MRGLLKWTKQNEAFSALGLITGFFLIAGGMHTIEGVAITTIAPVFLATSLIVAFGTVAIVMWRHRKVKKVK